MERSKFVRIRPTFDRDGLNPLGGQIVEHNGVSLAIVASIAQTTQDHCINGDVLPELLEPFIAGRVLAERFQVFPSLRAGMHRSMDP